MTATSFAKGSRAEAERQLAASAARHREAVASMQQLGRPEAGQHVAVKSVGRAVHLVSFALKRAAEADVPFERLVELTGWEPDLVREGLERPAPELRFVARLAPAGADARAVAEAAATFEAITRLHGLTQRLIADVDREAKSSSPLAPADLDALNNLLETAWRSWRQGLRPREPQ
ncbi:MAG TPA: hypothetical protein VN213_04270 [Solirubrobacteraceae bacterium]|nr:hypothetical protein [Solirubrobacteraceae bacterium]